MGRMPSVLDVLRGHPVRTYAAGEAVLTQGERTGLLYVLVAPSWSATPPPPTPPPPAVDSACGSVGYRHEHAVIRQEDLTMDSSPHRLARLAWRNSVCV